MEEAGNQERLSQRLVGPTYRNPESLEKYKPKGPLDDQRERINQVSREDDTFKNFRVGLQDMDDAFAYYFKEVIRPRAMADKNFTEVPLVYATPERWKAAQHDGVWRDKAGKRQIPIAIFKRDSFEKIRNISNKLDANRPHNFYVTAQHYSRRNPYSQFPLITNRVPEIEYVYTVIPDFVKLKYSCIILTEYMEQLNPILEAINFASDSYWGRQEKFKFHSFVGPVRTEVVENQGEDRTVRAEFSVDLNGYIVPETVNASPYINYKGRNKTTQKITLAETVIR